MALQWAKDGVPDDPVAWLITVASRCVVDEWRSESARRRREESVALELTGLTRPAEHDDTLTLLFLCCHPSLSVPSQLALTLRAHLLELAGDMDAARASYLRAARLTASLPEQRYLALQAARLG